MSKKITKRMLKDQDVPAKKARNVKGGGDIKLGQGSSLTITPGTRPSGAAGGATFKASLSN